MLPLTVPERDGHRQASLFATTGMPVRNGSADAARVRHEYREFRKQRERQEKTDKLNGKPEFEPSSPQLVAAELDALRGANDDFRSALDVADVDAALEADDRFHGVFVAASGNAMIAEVLEGATAVLRRVERIRFSSLDGRDSVRQHEGIIEAARAGDAEAAALRTRENWMSLPL